MKKIFIYDVKTVCGGYFMTIKNINFRLDAEFVKALKHLATDQDTTVTKLLLEAIEDLLKKYDKKSLKKSA
jgi:predicted transcriptional regulator